MRPQVAIPPRMYPFTHKPGRGDYQSPACFGARLYMRENTYPKGRLINALLLYTGLTDTSPV